VKDQRGFTLAEVVMALFVFGVVLATAVPVMMELERQHQARDERFYAMMLLQNRMEVVQQSQGVSGNGQHSDRLKGVRYQVKWETTKVAEDLIESQVVVSWKSRNGIAQRISLTGLQYRPPRSGEGASEALPISN
jgi:type II secretion system protein I